jgi:hypothetical protein
MSEFFILGVMMTVDVILGLYGLVIMRQIHREARETLLISRTTLDAAVKILQKLSA